jgi:peptide/nickel transport system substrate-binding protein
LNEVGLNVQVQMFEFTRYLDFVFAQENQPQIIHVSHDNPLLDADRTLSAYFHCTGRISAYCNEAVSRLIDDARTETDEAQREQMYWQATQISYDEAALIYMLNVENIYGLSTRLNWEPRLDGKVFFSDMSLN